MDRFFEFEKAKLFDTWKRSRNNRFSNKKIEEFHDCFKQFYDKIKHEDVAILSEDKKEWLKKAIDYLAIKTQVTPHTIRHTFATDMLNSGADLMTVKELLGHENINTTSIYTHVRSDLLRKEYDEFHPRG